MTACNTAHNGEEDARPFRGRLAPSPTGYMHLGHARTFWIAQQRTQQHGGTLVLRNEDLDIHRRREEFVSAMFEDLHWFGFEWQEGPDCGGPRGPYSQSERHSVYVDALRRLREGGFIYPCICSRKDILTALGAPHQGEEEPVYPGLCRPQSGAIGASQIEPNFTPGLSRQGSGGKEQSAAGAGEKINWRFRVPDGETVAFTDGHFGPQRFVAGKDFGDFVVWRHDGLPSYQLSVTVDDATMGITEVVRGADLLLSTARQWLIYQALGWTPPAFYHCPLMTDDKGVRLAKRHDSLSLRTLRAQGKTPEELRAGWGMS